MRDLILQNPATVNGNPTLVDGALTDGNQALSLNGTTQTVTVADSVSDSLAVAASVSGGMAVECFVKLAAYPTVTGAIITKPGSYALTVDPAGKAQFILGSADGLVPTLVVTSNTTLALNTWHHIVGVYNGDYTGPTVFGRNTPGTSGTGVLGDYRAGALTGSNNLQVSRFQAQEQGALTSLVMRLSIESSAPYSQDIAAVIYEDDAGSPGDKVGQSAGQLLAPTTLGGSIPLTNQGSIWWEFPVEAAVYAGFYWLGFAGGALHTSNTTVLVCGANATGGTRRGRNSVVSASDSGPASQEVADPFGTPTLSDSLNLDVYANYTATGRKGDEGRANLYINGRLDQFATHTHGVADSTDPITMASGLALQLDEVSIWDRKLSAVEVAAHYASR